MDLEDDRREIFDRLTSLSSSFASFTDKEKSDFYNIMQEISLRSRFNLGFNFGSEDLNNEIFLLKSVLPDAKVIFDVGANAGWWSAIALEHWREASIYTYEPQKHHASNIEEKVLSSSERMHYFALAVSDQIGAAQIFRDMPGSGLASLHKRDLSRFFVDFEDTETVKTTTLAFELARLGIEGIDILKIDVEGHELAVLRGLGQRIHSVRLIQFEFGGAMIDSRCFMRDFYGVLENAGLSRIMRMTPHGLLDLGPYAEQLEGFEMANYVAIRPK